MDGVAEIRRGGPMDALVAESVYFILGPLLKLAAIAGSGEDGKCDQISSKQCRTFRQMLPSTKRQTDKQI